MTSSNYWLDLFTGTTWQEFLDAGAEVSGFRSSRWPTVKKIRPGDYLICYLTGVSRFIGMLEVTSEPYQNETTIWGDASFSSRVKVKPLVTLTPETAVPIHDLRDQLTIFQNLKSPHAWTGRLRGSPSKWKTSDGEAILEALHEAQENPVRRPVDERKLRRRPRALEAKIGTVTVPEDNEEDTDPTTSLVTIQETSDHTDIQYHLLKLGRDMGFDVWVARNDRNRAVKGKPFTELFKLKETLPLQFDEATTRTIEYIDVLWLQKNAIVSAFEIESTTSIYSGLLRMSDLLAMQPNLNIPLYIVAPDERRDKVFSEVNRPTFSRLTPPLVDVCRYISFDTLRQQLQRVEEFVRYLKPDFIEGLSEGCEIDE